MDKSTKISDFLNLGLIKGQSSAPKVNEVRIFGEIYEAALYDLDEQIKANENTPLELLINSGGGSVFDGVAMASLIKRHKAETTATGLGFVASIASVVLLSADNVRLNKGALLMIHNAWTFDAGEAEDLRKTAGILEKINAQIVEVYLSKVKQNDKLINNSISETRAALVDMMNKETYLSADEALKIGLIDEIVNDNATLKPLTDEQLKNIVNKYGASAPKSFLNMAKMNNNPQENEADKIEANQETTAGLWATLKAFFSENPDKLKEVSNEADQEQEKEEMPNEESDEDKEKEAIEQAKELLKNAGYTVLDDNEQAKATEENEALQNTANLATENLNNLQKDYNFIMSKLKEFEAEFNGPSSKAQLNDEQEKPKQKNTIDTILDEYNENANTKESKFFKMLNN